MRIDDEGVRLNRAFEDRLSLEIAGRRVWTFVGARDGRRDGNGQRLVAWPEMLKPYLNGKAEVRVRSLESAEVLFDDVVALGDGIGPVVLIDGEGRPLTVSKTKHLSGAMFADATAGERTALVDAIVESLDFLRSRGHDAFLAYGNLLGAVRDGKLIGHDDDADIAYVSETRHPIDLMLESFSIERECQAAGWETLRMSGGTFKLIVALPTGLRIGIDVFASFYFQGLLHMMPAVAADLPREVLLPTSTVTLEGRQVPAPARPEALLEASFGAGWRVPDPSFTHQPPRWLKRRLSGLLRGERQHQNYWDIFYATKAAKVPAGPSSFARWVTDLDPRPTSLLDIGSGTGRDSLWFAEQGLRVMGCDYSLKGVEYARARADERGVQASFRRLNLYDLRQMLAAGALLGPSLEIDAVYARFLVHALEDEGRENLWRLSRSVLAHTRGRIYLEFRTEPTHHQFGEHYRKFVHPEQVASELTSYGFRIEHLEDRHGLAVHKGEDPRVCRIIAKLEALK